MRIAFISTMAGLPWGGSEELWVKTANYALDNGNSVAVSVIKWDKVHSKIKNLQDKGAIIEFRDERAISFSGLSNRLAHKIKTKARNYIKDDYKTILDFKPDFLIVNQAGTFDAATNNDKISNLVNQLNVPYVIICNNSLLDGHVLSSNQRDISQQFFKKAKYVIFTAIKTKQDGEKSLAADINNSIILRNPYNLPNILELKYPPVTGTIFMACVGGVNIAAKGQDILLEVLSREIWKNRNFELHIFGDGPDKHYLNALIDYYQLQDKVFFKGYANNIRELWAEHHLLVLPSRLESSPAVIVEAMLCSRPTVANNVGGVGEWITDDYNGFLAEAPNVVLLAKALEKAWANVNRWEEMGKSAYQDALDKIDYSPEKTLLDLFSK